MLEKIKTGLDNAKEFKKDIDWINYVFGVLGCDNPVVNLVHKTQTKDIYVIEYKEKNNQRGIRIDFWGTMVIFGNDKHDQRVMEKYGYIGWRLKVLEKNIKYCIKKQERAEARAQKKQDVCNQIRYKLIDKVFGHSAYL